jgi:predicted  nucleic acid-binding Zn-ribbon protein
MFGAISQQERESILRDCRILINTKFQGGAETLDPNSQGALQQLHLSLTAAKNELSSIQLALNHLTATDQTLRSDIDKSKSSIVSLEETFNRSLKLIATDVEGILKRLASDTAAADVLNISQDLAKVVQQVRDVKATSDELKKTTDILAARQSSAPSGQSITDQSVGEVVRLTREIAQAAGSAQKAQARLNQLEESLEKLTQQVQALAAQPPASQTPNLQVSASSLAERIQKVEEGIKALQSDSQRISALESQIQANGSRLKNLEDSLSDLRSGVTTIGQSVTTLVSLAAARTELEAVVKRVQELEAKSSHPVQSAQQPVQQIPVQQPQLQIPAPAPQPGLLQPFGMGQLGAGIVHH